MERPDEINLDGEHIDDTLRTPGYGLIRRRAEGEIARLIKELVGTRHDEPETAELRGKILGLQTALKIPENIATESRKVKSGR